MEHFKEGQYDDDLTQGNYDDDLTADINEYDDDFDTGDIDLFGFTDDEDSVLGRLKSIILSIEWEITNDILRQFNEELLELKNIWVGNKVNLIYVQALEKLSKYIYKEKSSAHPHAIKLLLTFYSNLERIVSDESISDLEKKKILRTDIELFEKLKKQISQSVPVKATPKDSAKDTPLHTPEKEKLPASSVEETESLQVDTVVDAGKPDLNDPLLNLKAIVYGIDWEVTENDLANLSNEVKLLEKKFADSKAKKIFLQGIGSLGSYINLKRSDAHADAFKLLHSFFIGLETVVHNNLSGQAEKDVLLPQVEKFNVFKSIIADTISPERLSKSSTVEDDVEDDLENGEIQPAFADVPDDVHGFQVDDGEEQQGADEYFVDNDEETEDEPPADSALTSEMESRLDGMFDEPSKEAALQLDKNKALQGVNVETEDDDDSEEEPLPEEDGELAPALAAEEPFPLEESPAVFTDKDEDIFEETKADEPEFLGSEVPGVDVEHEADDDSDEEPLPFEGDEYAPALSDSGGETDEIKRKPEDAEKGDIDSRLDDFFGDSKDSEDEIDQTVEAISEDEPVEKDEPGKETDEITGRLDDFFKDSDPDAGPGAVEEAIKGVDVETEDDDDSDEEPLPFEGDEYAPALSGDEETTVKPEDDFGEEEIEDSSDEDEELTSEVDIEDQGEAKSVDDRFDELFGEEEDEQDVSPEQDLSEDMAVEKAGETDFSFDDEEEVNTPEEFDELLDEKDDDVGVTFDQSISEETEIQIEEDWSAKDELRAKGERSAVTDLPYQEEKEKSSDGASDYEAAGFEEIFDDEIEEFPEESFAAESEEEQVEEKEATDDEAILAYFADEEQDDEDDQQPIAAFSDDTFDEDIPQMEADELATVIDDDAGISAAGSVPSGYPSTDELLREFGEVAGADDTDDTDDISHPEGDEDFIIGVEGPDVEDELEDEVVFRAVDESQEVAEISKDEDEEDDTFGMTLLDDEQYTKKPEIPIEENEITEVSDIEASEEAVEKEETDRSSAYIRPQGERPFQENLGEMRNCIASLGLEIDTDILNSLNEEIDKLRHVWMDKPAEKTFVQLLSTITGHINKYRYEADQEANRLLLSVFDKLEITALGQANETEIQEALLNETSKVLHWQARLIDRTPITADTAEDKLEQQVFDQESPLLGGIVTDDDFAIGLEDMSKKVDEIGNDMLMQKVSNIMKEELEQLKRDFQAELHELRKDLLRNSGQE